MCFDGVKRLCHIRGKLRKKVWINQSDIILVGLRDYQDAKADVIQKYSADEARNLKSYGEFPESIKINETVDFVGGDLDDDIEFDDVDSDDSGSDDADDIDGVVTARVVAVNIIELDVVIQISSDKVDRLIDLDGLWELAVRLEVSGLVRRVLLDHVSLSVLVITETDQDDIRLVYPDLLTKFPSDVTETLNSVEAHRLETPVTKHLGDLSVLLSVLLKDQLPLDSINCETTIYTSW